MQKIEFKDYPDTSTLINAENLKTMQDNVENVFNGEEAMGSIVVEDISSKNVFNKNTVTKGYRISKDDGTIVANEAVGISESIDVTGKTNLIVSGTTISYTNGGAFFDSSKNYISGFTSTEMLAGVNIPSTAKYVRINILLTELDTTQLEFGDTATPYSKYINFTGTTNFITGQEVATNRFKNGERIYVYEIATNLPSVINTDVSIAPVPPNFKRLENAYGIIYFGDYNIPFNGTNATLASNFTLGFLISVIKSTFANCSCKVTFEYVKH